LPKSKAKAKQKELTVDKIKKLFTNLSIKGKTGVDPKIHDMRIVEDNLTFRNDAVCT
jgi:hypothetical protein